MRDIYGVAAFRSRQQVLRFEAALNRQGVPAQVVTTPRDIAMGCGLSVRFPMERLQDVKRALLTQNTSNLIGLYQAEYDGARLRVRPV
jgi:hypothetical protein